MKLSLATPILIGAISLLAMRPARACTGVEIGSGNQVTVGMNTGWFWPLDAGLVVNPRGMSKYGLKALPTDSSAHWISKFGSVTLNPIGREFPISGVNEKGLVVQGLHSYDGRYETKSGLPVVMMFQWVQYQLDLSANINEAIANAKKIRPLDSPQLTMHFFMCEASGRCAIFEWLNGALEIRTDNDMPVKAFTNTQYAQSLAAFQKCAQGECTPPEDPPMFSAKRFVQAASLAGSYDGRTDPSGYMFNLLDVVKQSTPLALWSVVIHNAGAATLEPLTLRLSSPGKNVIQFVNLQEYDFSCGHPVQMQLVDLQQTDNVRARFKDYDPAMQKLLVAGTRTPEARQKVLREYPEHTVCVLP